MYLMNGDMLRYNKQKEGPTSPAKGGTHEVGGCLRKGEVGGCLRVRKAEGGAHEPSERGDPRSGGMPSQKKLGFIVYED